MLIACAAVEIALTTCAAHLSSFKVRRNNITSFILALKGFILINKSHPCHFRTLRNVDAYLTRSVHLLFIAHETKYKID